MKSNCIIILLLVQSFLLGAQAPKHTIKVLAKVKPDGIWLRWAPADAAVWQLGNQHGYQIQRFTLNANGELNSKEPINLQTMAIKPLSEKELETLAKSNAQASVIQELIYETETRNTDEQHKGENPAQLLKQNEDLSNRFGMTLLICDLSPDLAQAAGLFFKDTTALKGARYIYKISLADASIKIAVDAGVMVVDVAEPKPLQPFTDLQATFGDKTMTLSWPTFTHAGIYTAYQIEKSSDGKIFKPISDLPYMPMREMADDYAHFVDSLATNAQVYYYRVIGLTPFGEKSPPSNIVSGTGKDNMAGLLILREVKRNDKNNAQVTWEFPSNFENKISNFVLEKAKKAEGPYTPIAKNEVNKKLRTATDLTATTSAYYQVKAVDTEGHELCHSHPYFFHVEDNNPPAIPSGLSGKVSAKGIVSLTWKNNQDPDLLGYRVFSSHDLMHEFIEITTQILPTPTYSDTVNIRVLNKKVYYKVIAVDHNFNTSNYSSPLTLYKPDVIAPAAPVFGKIESSEQSILLNWINSISSDVATYTLYRTLEQDTVRKELLRWRADKSKNQFEDNTVVAGQTYRYALLVHDSAGNKSSVNSKVIQLRSGLPKAITDMTATIERDKKLITLTWEYDREAHKCLLYRRKNNEPFTLYQSLDGAVHKFVDDQVLVNNTYAYKIQLVLDRNAKNELSKELKVPF